MTKNKINQAQITQIRHQIHRIKMNLILKSELILQIKIILNKVKIKSHLIQNYLLQ